MSTPAALLEQPSASVAVPRSETMAIADIALPGRPAMSPSTVVDVGPNAHANYFLVWADPKGASKKLDVRLQDGATARVLGVFFGRNREHYHVDVRTTHLGKNTEAFTKIRGVLADSALASFKGMIKIDQRGNGTNAYLEEHVLLLGEKAKSVAEPNLEIEAPDVRASHAATTGRIDANQLLYVMSRGISETQATRMIVEGFLRDILDVVPSDLLQSAFRELLTQGLSTITPATS